MAFKPSGRGEKPSMESEEPNLIPIMNLMVILIPMLLLNYHFINLAMLNTSLPATGEGGGEQQEKKKDEKPKLNLTVSITLKGFTLAGAGGVLVKKDGPTIPVIGDNEEEQWKNFDYKKLNDMLLDIKKKYPYEKDIIIMPAPKVDYQTIISTMDAVRKVRNDDFSEDVNKDGKANELDKVLFPGVNISPGIF